AAGFLNETGLTLYDSVHVIESGFTYTDTSVSSDEVYTYKVLSRGTYGNPSIALQENFSQAVSLYPINDLSVCAPIVAVESSDCDEYLAGNTCEQSLFDNRIGWIPDGGSGCRTDIVSYRVYAGDARDTSVVIVAETAATMFREEGLASPVRCYRVSAVDASGNESALSEPACSTSCPFFSLPNVFTPNADGCNDLFSSRFHGPSEGAGECGYSHTTYCPRFVKSLKISIYNRWGKKVYTSDSNLSGSIYVDWDGTDENGSPVATGIYYYVAEVHFDVLEPEKEYKVYKDWIHLIR
ncbi:MAG TPA: gliding motility-associated C-terminal domain-containing protein, partial [Chryseosolibacter sp.]|nr:gliding motility-associated C-terminal domain-containing protein [Chryseosolibacter sp.]